MFEKLKYVLIRDEYVWTIVPFHFATVLLRRIKHLIFVQYNEQEERV